MRDVLLLVGFALCVVIGAVTVVWPELSTSDDPTAPSASQPTKKTAGK